jgi:hypothetical protein
MLEYLRVLLKNPVIRMTALAFLSETVMYYTKAFVNVSQRKIEDFVNEDQEAIILH